MPRRGMNIYKRKDGRWEGRIQKAEDGLPAHQYTSVYGSTYSEVKSKMEEVRSRKKPTVKLCCSMAEALDMWFTDRKPYWKPTTRAAYLHMVRKHILPRLGAVKAGGVDNRILEKLVSDIRSDSGAKKLSNGYLHNICSVIIRALLHLKKVYYHALEIPDNPVSGSGSGKSRIMLPGENSLAVLETYLLSEQDDPACLGILTALYTGMRIGELCALTWKDISLEEEVIYIRSNMQRVRNSDGQKNKTGILFQTPKTAASVRMIPIPPVLLPLLAARKGEDSRYLIRGRKNPWTEPRTLQYRLAGILKKCGIGRFNFHLLRHTFATRCMAMGFDVKSLSEILGHSNVQTTLNLYVHSTMQHKKQLMGMFDPGRMSACPSAG